MNTIYNFLMSNIYLFICIVIALIIVSIIISIVASNYKNRKKIKEDFVEAEKVEEELEKIETPNELENILKKMQEDVNIKPEDVVKKFEEEQEEKAIISYKELVDNVNQGKIEVVDDEDSSVNYVENLNLEEETPILSQSDENSSVTPEMVKEAIENISNSSVKEVKKFKNSEFISPIYGIMEDKLEYPKVKKAENILDIMNTRDYNELTEEIKRQEEFLEALKTFRNNL